MLRTKTTDRIVCFATVFMLIAAVCLWGIVEPVQGDGSHEIGYESLLFDQSRVHTIEITADNWDEVIANATAEEYRECTIVIDGENLGKVGIRAKGNTSLSSVATLGSTRYSFKVEFSHYVKGKKYHGLDKLSLNNLIQDATMMKDYLAYSLMNKMGVPSSLCSYVQITVNGEPWGLYLAVEGVEEAFLERNGMTKGELYKPDSMSFGGGRGNGRDFDLENFREKEESPDSSETTEQDTGSQDGAMIFNPADNPFGSPPGGMAGNMPDGMPQMPEGGFSFPGGGFSGTPGSGDASADQAGNFPQQPGGDFGDFGGFGGFNFGMGSDDVKLVYTDDDPDSYSNIFNNAKTNISNGDKTRLIASLKKLSEGEDLDSVVNKDEVITYLAVHNFLCNDDSYTGMMVHNYYLYEEKGKLTILPWDYNLAFGGFSASQDATSTVNSPIDSPVSSGTTDSRPLISWIFSDEESLAAYHEAYDRFISECVESGWLEAEITRVHDMISPYVESDPSAFYTAEEFEKAIDTLRTFCAKRAKSIRGQLEGTIPSTTQAQRADSSSLIDAGEISPADMGKMDTGNNQGGGPGGGMLSGMPDMGSIPDMNQGTMPQGMPDMSSMPDFGSGMSFPGVPGSGTGTEAKGNPISEETTESPAEIAEANSKEESADSAGQKGVPEGFTGSPPDGVFPGGGPFAGGGYSSEVWIWTAVCAAVLLAAVLIIRKTGDHNS